MEEPQRLDNKRRALTEFLAHQELDDSASFSVLDDGGMGSFLVLRSGKRATRMWPSQEARYVDDDGIDVLITLSRDQYDYPAEVAFWKVNFDPLIKFPTSNDIELVELKR